MTIIERDRITINRGDDVDLPVGVVYLPICPCDKPVEYEVKPDDVFTFTLYRGTKPGSDVIYEATGDPGDRHIRIPASDTEWMRPGKYYCAIGLHTEGKHVRVWPVERPDQFGKIRHKSNFVVNEGEVY